MYGRPYVACPCTLCMHRMPEQFIESYDHPVVCTQSWNQIMTNDRHNVLQFSVVNEGKVILMMLNLIRIAEH